MSIFSIARFVLFGLSLLFSFVVLGLSAHLIQESTEILRAGPAVFEALGIAVSGLTIIALVPMLIIGMLRKGAFTSMIVVEAPVLSVLWILWIALAAISTDTANFNFPLGCSAYIPFYMQLCTELTAVQGLSFVVWLFMMVYSLTLSIFSLVATSRGNRVWFVSVSEATFFAQSKGTNNGLEPSKGATMSPNYQYPPMQATNGGDYGMASPAPQNQGAVFTQMPNQYAQGYAHV